MRVVVDANILVGALTNATGRRLLNHPDLFLMMTEDAWQEANEHLERRLETLTRGGRITDVVAELVRAARATVETRIQRIPSAAFATALPLAASLMPDPDDVPTLALAMATGAAVWTHDRHFWGCGIAVWITERLRIRLDRAPSYE